MDQRPPTFEFTVEAFVDPPSVRDVVRGILHTIFFHRFFPSVLPRTRDVLDLTLPYIEDAELETLIDQRTNMLVRQLEEERGGSGGGTVTGTVTGVGAGLGSAAAAAAAAGGGPGSGAAAARAAAARASQHHHHHSAAGSGPGSTNRGGGRGQIAVQFFEKRRRKSWYGIRGDEEVCWESWTVKVTVAEPRTENERAKVAQAMEATLLQAVMKIVTAVNAHKDHIPPITTAGTNPFPYQINVNQKEVGWVARMGIY